MSRPMKKPSPPRHQPGLNEEEADRVRVVVERLVTEHGSQSAVARLLGVSPTTISRCIAEDVRRREQAGPDFAELVAKHLGMERDELIGRNTAPRTEPRLRDLDGWNELEAEARLRFRWLPPRAWDVVGNLRTATPPRNVTADWIGNIVSDWSRVLGGEGDETETWRSKGEAMKKAHQKS